LARWLLCVLVFVAHFFLRDRYVEWSLSSRDDIVLVYFLPEAASLPVYFDDGHPSLYQWLACGSHPDNPGVGSRCAMRLPAGMGTVSSQALSRLQALAVEQSWPVDASRLAFVKRHPDPSREWFAMLRLSAFDVLAAILLAWFSAWNLRQDVRAARSAWKSPQWWWVLVPMAGGGLWSIAANSGMFSLANTILPRDVLWPGLFSLAVVAPVYEEVTYRGWLYTLRPSLPWWVFALVTSAPFALSHGETALPTVYFFFSGILLAWVLYRTRSILLTMLAHGIHNVVAAF